MRKRLGGPLPLLLLVGLVTLAGCSEIFSSGYDYGRIRVSMVDQAGDPVPGALLTLYTGKGHQGFGRTDGSGNHVFEFVPLGSYGIEAGAPPGYRFTPGPTEHRFTSIEEGGEAVVEFVLERESPPELAADDLD